MSVEALKALQILREQLYVADRKDIPEGYQSVTEWSKAWNLGDNQTRKMLAKGLETKLFDLKRFNMKSGKVSYYKFLGEQNGKLV